MSGRIRLRRWPKWLSLAISLLVFLLAWWLEDDYLVRPNGRQNLSSIPSGEYEVLRVIDGDTLILRQNKLRVRLQGIDTPETVKQYAPVEPWGPEATAYTKQFIANAGWRVRLDTQGKTLDRYGRHIAFLWHNGRLLNEELVHSGLARAKTNYDFSEQLKNRLRRAQSEAQQAKRGIWSE